MKYEILLKCFLQLADEIVKLFTHEMNSSNYLGLRRAVLIKDFPVRSSITINFIAVFFQVKEAFCAILPFSLSLSARNRPLLSVGISSCTPIVSLLIQSLSGSILDFLLNRCPNKLVSERPFYRYGATNPSMF